MRKLLNICDNYADDYDVMFNAQKSKFMAFLGKNRSYLRTYLNDGLFCIVLGIIQSILFSLTLIPATSLMRPLRMTMMILCADATAVLISLIMYCAISKNLVLSKKYKLFASYCTRVFRMRTLDSF